MAKKTVEKSRQSPRPKSDIYSKAMKLVGLSDDAEPRRECPPQLEAVIELFNELPRTDEEIKECLKRYDLIECLSFREADKSTFARSYPLTYHELGIASPEWAEAKLHELVADRRRAIGIIQSYEFIVIQHQSKSPFSRAQIIRQSALKMDQPIYHVGFAVDGRMVLPKSRILTVLLNLSNAFHILDRLFVCPHCEDIKWTRTTRTETCGKTTCVNRLAYIRKKAKAGKTMTPFEVEIIDRFGPGVKYKPRKGKTNKRQ